MSAAASALGRLLERRIELRFKVHSETQIEIINENTLVQAYGACCFGLDHFIRSGNKQVHIQEKWESHAPKLRDLRHFVVASQALQAKLPLLETPLRIFFSRRRIDAPESLFVLQASATESISNFTDIEKGVEALYNRICLHFNLQPKAMTAELLQEIAAIEFNFVKETRETHEHRLQPIIQQSLNDFAINMVPPLLNVMYGQQVASDVIQHIQDLVSNNSIALIIKFFKSRRATPLEYDTWLQVLRILRPIQVMMEQVNAETGRRIYSRGLIGEPALQPTEQEQIIERSRLHNAYKRRTVVNVIKEN